MRYIYLLLFLIIPQLLHAQTVTVTNLSDDGSAGSFRWAILQANADPSINEIIFDAALTGTITLTSNLPNIAEGLTIRGPGALLLSISGNNLYKMFMVNTSVTLTISDLTFKQCGASAYQNGSMFYVTRSRVIATNIIVTENSNSTPFYSKDGGSLISISNSTFTANSSTLFGSDYGNTPSTTENDSVYENKIIVTGSTFSNNTGLIFNTERFVKIDSCIFNNNTTQLANFRGLNRYQVLNSTFTNNTGYTLFYFYSTIAQGTFLSTLGSNHHLFDSNTFSGNTGVVIYPGSANELQKTTLTNNTFINNGVNWDGNPAVVSGNYLDNFITSVSHNLSTSTVTVTMSKAVYSGANSVGALDVNDFQFALAGGNATLVATTPSSISVSGNVYTLGIQLNGFSSGSEILTISPVLNSIYDASNNIANVFQKNFTTNLKFLDDDLDGVANFMDQCPNTPVKNFVNVLTGCTDLAAGVIWNGPYLNFTKVDGADFTLPINQDSISNTVILTRGDRQGLFNIASETFYDRSSSPSQTQWVSVSNDQLTANDIRGLNFTNWVDAFQNNPPGQVNNLFLVYLPDQKIYFYLKLLSWSRSSGGFSYERTTLPNSSPTAINLNVLNIDENSEIGSVVGTFSTIDPDVGDTHTYTLVSGLGDTDNNSFDVIAGELKVNEVFNFEFKNNYSIRVRSTDALGLSIERTFTITINNVNEAPFNISLSNSTINENNPIGATVGNIISNDTDEDDKQTYALVSGIGDTDNNIFKLINGQLKVNEVFDFELKNKYSIRIRSTDLGGLTFDQIFLINVANVNESPSAILLANTAINENSAVGTLVATLSAVDQDNGDTHTYNLVSGIGDDNNKSFEVIAGQLKAKEVFDFEYKPNYSIRLRVTDAGGLSFEQAFTINIININEQPTINIISDFTTCATNDLKKIRLTGITAGPEMDQKVTISVSSNNTTMLKNLAIGSISNGAADLSFSLTDGVFGTAVVTVLVTDNGGKANEGIDQISRSFSVTVNPIPTVSISSDLGDIVSKGKTVKLSVLGGEAVSYLWTNVDGIIAGQNTAILTVRPAQNTSYTVTVTNSNGCQTQKSFLLKVIDDYQTIALANLVTPNGDGVNDYLIIKNVDLYPQNELKIFDRAGRQIYIKKGYNNEWNGTLKGAPLAEGIYFYIIDFGQGNPKLKGNITIVRD